MSGNSIEVIKNVYVPMRDGVHLAAYIVRPSGGGKYPAIVELNPYRKDDAAYNKDMLRAQYFFAERGYAILRADIRGTGASEGTSTEMWNPVEIKDSYDLVEWVAKQEWCNGNVGMWGSSYGGNTSYYAAMEGAPHLKAIIPMHCADDTYLAQFRGGCLRPFLFAHYGPLMTSRNFAPPIPSVSSEKWLEIWKKRLENNVPWTVPFIENQTSNEFWHARSLTNYDKIKCPTFLIDGWQDWHATAALNMFMKIKAPKKVLIGPWSHFGGSQVGNSGPPPDTAIPGPAIDYLRECAKWFDHWLKGVDNGVTKEPPVTIFVRTFTTPSTFQFKENGHYRSEAEWPIARTKNTAFHLHPNGLLSADSYSVAKSEHDDYDYDPTLGVMSEPRAGQSEFRTALDQRPDELHSLVYTSQPLDQDLEVTGHPRALLYVSSSADATLFAVKLCDVAEDGTSALVTQGKLNATHRTSHEKVTPLEPGKIYELQIDLKATSYVFQRGHRIRVDIASADVPDALPMPTLCRNSVYRGKDHPSQVVLPVAPEQHPILKEPDLRLSTLAPYSEEGWKSFVERPVYLVTRDFINKTFTITAKKLGLEPIDEQTKLRTTDIFDMTIATDNPANSSIKALAEYTILTPQFEIEILSNTTTVGTLTKYHLMVEVEAKVNGARHFNKSWNVTVPRQC
jgi:hypothetical protein